MLSLSHSVESPLPRDPTKLKDGLDLSDSGSLSLEDETKDVGNLKLVKKAEIRLGEDDKKIKVEDVVEGVNRGDEDSSYESDSNENDPI